MSLASRQFEMWHIWTESPIQSGRDFLLSRHCLVFCDLVLPWFRGGFQWDDWLDGMYNRNLYLDVHWYPRRLGRVHYCALFFEIRQHETGKTRWQTGFQRRNVLHNAVRRWDRSRFVLFRSRYVLVFDFINLSKSLGKKPRCIKRKKGQLLYKDQSYLSWPPIILLYLIFLFSNRTYLVELAII